MKTINDTNPTVELDSEIMIEEIDAFLRDPIGFGDYDDSDPIGLDEFITCRHYRGDFVAPLAW